MSDSPQSDCVLRDILKVLQRIEDRLNSHEERFHFVEEHSRERVGATNIEGSHGYPDAEASTFTKAETNQAETDGTRPSRKGTPVNDPRLEDHDTTKIPYSQWSFNHTNGFINFDLSATLQKRLGDCWFMPDDNRLPLNFFRSNVSQVQRPWSERQGIFPTARLIVEGQLDFLCQFDYIVRKQPGNDFMIADFDANDNTRLYRLGSEAVGEELEVEAQGTKDAPWSRLVLYQGATTGDSTHIARKLQQKPIPYFSSTDKILGLWDHLDYHLQTKRRGTTTNPYLRPWTGFHTTFFEVREVTEWSVRELWKHGPLYCHPLGWHFRKSAYTIYGPVSADAVDDSRHLFSKINRNWTLLVLAPDYFFDDKNSSFPMSASSPGRGETLGYALGKLTGPGAEIHLIGQGLERITQRWADFLSYFDYILDGSDSLMKPAEHDNLLFDDGAFSRSRKYFWAIDCLTEFELSITDNIVQWELYKAARVTPLSDLPEVDHRQFVFAERQYRILQNQRESFRHKLTSTRALRDALFNASAVIESRASTRLGENVKLLTFVTIFFLPLAFTTSLWSVNDRFSMTSLIYVIIIVALVTYFTMFNIDSLAEGFGGVYDSKKKHIVWAMKNDKSESWKLRGQRFEVFRPKHENPEPSEWYIPLYALMHPSAVLGCSRKGEAAAPHMASRVDKPSKAQSADSTSTLFRRRKQKVEEPEDQPWVIEPIFRPKPSASKV